MMGNLGGRTRMLAWGVALALLPRGRRPMRRTSAGPAQWTLAVTEETTSVEPGTAAAANATVLVLRHLFEPLAAYEGYTVQADAQAGQVVDGEGQPSLGVQAASGREAP